MPSLSLMRLSRCSSTLNASSNNLVFSLPCLTTKETAFIQLQLDTVNSHQHSVCKTSLLRNRVNAIASAYMVEDTSLAILSKLCAFSSVNEYFKSHEVLTGLTYGEVMGSTKMWLDIAQRNNFKYQQTFNNFVQDREFKEKYSERLVEVINKLGLDDLSYIVNQSMEGQDLTWDFHNFSQKFYEKAMVELCGISNLKEVEKYYQRNLLVKPCRSLDHKDPINFLRTYYIMGELLNLNIDMSLKHLALLGRVSALEMLVTLNMLERRLHQDKEDDVRKTKVASDSAKFAKMYVENQFLWSLPVTSCIQMLEEIGFTNSEVGQLMLMVEGKKNGIQSEINKNLKTFEMNRLRFVDVMKKRLQILRKEKGKLGIANVLHTYRFLFNWEKVVSIIDMTEMANNRCFLWFGRHNQVKVQFHPVRTRVMSASRVYLMEYFGIKEEDKEKVNEFNKFFSRIPHAKDVPLRIVVESVMYLESLGLSKHQIEKGFPVVFYSKSILSQYIPKLDKAVGGDWMKKENVLCLLNYFIEVEQKFSFDLIYSGIINAYEGGMSDEFFSTLAAQAQQHTESTEKTQSTLESSTSSTNSVHSGNLLSHPNEKHLASQSIGVSLQEKHVQLLSAPVNRISSRSLHTSPLLLEKREDQEKDILKKVKIYHFQNPLTWLQIHLKFNEVKQRWDPNLDKEEFLFGVQYAVQAITNNIVNGDWHEMRGLLSRKEFKRLRKEVETEWSDVMRQNVGMEVDQMEKVLITGITTQQIVEHKYCDIDVTVVGVKEKHDNTPHVIQVRVRLHREYTEGCLPDWMVSRFSINNWGSRNQRV